MTENVRFWDAFAFLTEQISISRSWVDDVVAVTRLQSSAESWSYSKCYNLFLFLAIGFWACPIDVQLGIAQMLFYII